MREGPKPLERTPKPYARRRELPAFVRFWGTNLPVCTSPTASSLLFCRLSQGVLKPKSWAEPKILTFQSQSADGCQRPRTASLGWTQKVSSRLGPRIEKQIERGHRMLEAAMELRIFRISGVVHPLGRDAG